MSEYEKLPLRERLEPFIKRFRIRYDELEIENSLEDRTGSERRAWLKEKVQGAFSSERIDTLEKEEVIDILSSFFSIEYSAGGSLDRTDEAIAWANKIVHRGFVEVVRDLLHTGDYEKVYNGLIGIQDLKRGIASEFLCYLKPDKFSIISSKSLRAHRILGFGDVSIPMSGPNSWKRYQEFNENLKVILNELRKDEFFSDADFTTLNDFLSETSSMTYWLIDQRANAQDLDDLFRKGQIVLFNDDISLNVEES